MERIETVKNSDLKEWIGRMWDEGLQSGPAREIESFTAIKNRARQEAELSSRTIHEQNGRRDLFKLD